MFSYTGVESFMIEIRETERPGYRDLLAHEFRIEGRRFIHELQFAGSDRVMIRFEHVVISEQPLGNGAG